jgi:hypothetical protein
MKQTFGGDEGLAAMLRSLNASVFAHADSDAKGAGKEKERK